MKWQSSMKLPDKNVLISLYADGLTLKQIGEMYKASGEAVRMAIKKPHSIGAGGYITGYPPSHVLELLRERGHTPEEIYRMCLR